MSPLNPPVGLDLSLEFSNSGYEERESFSGQAGQRRIAKFAHLVSMCVGLIFFFPGLAKAADESAPLSQDVALIVQPYAQMSFDAYRSGQGDLKGAGYTIDMDWTEAMRRGGVGEGLRAIYEKAGFSATIYRNDATKEIVIAYRGSDDKTLSMGALAEVGLRAKNAEGDWPTNLEARDLKSPQDKLLAQYVAARSLASRLSTIYAKTPYKDYRISLTGHSLGGGLASYAGQYVNAKIYTFDAARNVLSGTGENKQQTNVIVTGDRVSDPAAFLGQKFGSVDNLPGRTYRVDLPPLPGVVPKPDLRDRHSPEVIVSLIQKAATPNNAATSVRPATAPASPGVPDQPPSGAFTRPSNIPAVGPAQSAAWPTGQTATVRPGGISLTKAAAERMPLNITLDGAYFGEGKIVLSGRNANLAIDAALFLTTLRAACEQQDPYFSLDPDDGAMWTKQGEEAFDALWNRIKGDFQPDLSARRNEKRGSTLEVRTVSAARDYANLWREIAPRYPNFRSKLVFHPQWLGGTRLGEILYKADVLLKELSSGVPVLAPGQLRASSIDGYLAADAERAAKSLLISSSSQKESQRDWRGSRLWFDIAPPPSAPPGIAVAPPAQSVGKPELRSLLATRGLLRAQEGASPSATAIVRDGNVVDLSSLNPRMFVRIHDHNTGQDLSDHDPDLDGLANDVSKRFDRYAEAYDELRLLREVFRSYVAAVHIVTSNGNLCARLDTVALLDSEKVSSPLPEYHRSELFVTVAIYKIISRASRQAFSAMASSLNGGVSIAGKRIFETRIRDGQTPITQEIRKRVAESNISGPSDLDPSRQFVLLTLGEDLLPPVRVVSNAQGTGLLRAGRDEYEIENEPPAAALPTSQIGVNLTSVVVLVLVTVIFAAGMRRRRA